MRLQSVVFRNLTEISMYRLILALGAAISCIPAVFANDYPAVGGVERLQPALDELVPADAVVERLTEDVFQWSEGPVWVTEGQYVLFSDVPKNTAWMWSERDGLEIFFRPASLDDGREKDPSGQGSNGLMLSIEGNLLMCDHGSRSVVEVDLVTKEKKMLAGEYREKRFNSPNDLAVSRLRWPGTVFFTDPPYGLKGQDKSPLKEIEINGIYRLDPDGSVVLLEDALPRPNGIAMSPDETHLYVANSYRENTVWMVYDLDAQGGIEGEGRVFASAQDRADAGAKGLPDGMAVDVEGNVWATGPGGVYVISPEGEILGLVETGTAIANCAFGGEDGSILYMTSHGFLARIQTLTRGIEFQ